MATGAPEARAPKWYLEQFEAFQKAGPRPPPPLPFAAESCEATKVRYAGHILAADIAIPTHTDMPRCAPLEGMYTHDIHIDMGI